MSIFLLEQKKARKYLKVLHDLVKISDSANASALMYNMRKIGGQYTDALAEYEEFFKTLKENPALQDHAQGILDIIAGRTYVIYHIVYSDLKLL